MTGSAVTAADFDVAYDDISSYEHGSDEGASTVQAGDTLSSIAASLWGDASLWYKLAEINGLTGDAPLIEDTKLIVPAGVIRDTNNVATFTRDSVRRADVVDHRHSHVGRAP